VPMRSSLRELRPQSAPRTATAIASPILARRRATTNLKVDDRVRPARKPRHVRTITISLLGLGGRGACRRQHPSRISHVPAVEIHRVQRPTQTKSRLRFRPPKFTLATVRGTRTLSSSAPECSARRRQRYSTSCPAGHNGSRRHCPTGPRGLCHRPRRRVPGYAAPGRRPARRQSRRFDLDPALVVREGFGPRKSR
jgi:hypothetical protein